VRAVHRELRRIDPDRPTPEAIGSWIGQLVSE
jgi:hypothetical protein